MTEQEYCDLSDLQLLRSVIQMLLMINAMDDPNATRLRSIRANLYLMTEHLEPKISEYMDSDANVELRGAQDD